MPGVMSVMHHCLVVLVAYYVSEVWSYFSGLMCSSSLAVPVAMSSACCCIVLHLPWNIFVSLSTHLTLAYDSADDTQLYVSLTATDLHA